MRTLSSVEEALEDRNWVGAMNEEIKVLEKNGVWEIVERQGSKKVVGWRWIYVVKYKLDDTFDCYKAN